LQLVARNGEHLELRKDFQRPVKQRQSFCSGRAQQAAGREKDPGIFFRLFHATERDFSPTNENLHPSTGAPPASAAKPVETSGDARREARTEQTADLKCGSHPC
jgi:hypothetical protein